MSISIYTYFSLLDWSLSTGLGSWFGLFLLLSIMIVISPPLDIFSRL